jgi:hypothetical protein
VSDLAGFVVDLGVKCLLTYAAIYVPVRVVE